MVPFNMAQLAQLTSSEKASQSQAQPSNASKGADDGAFEKALAQADRTVQAESVNGPGQQETPTTLEQSAQSAQEAKSSVEARQRGENHAGSERPDKHSSSDGAPGRAGMKASGQEGEKSSPLERLKRGRRHGQDVVESIRGGPVPFMPQGEMPVDSMMEGEMASGFVAKGMGGEMGLFDRLLAQRAGGMSMPGMSGGFPSPAALAGQVASAAANELGGSEGGANNATQALEAATMNRAADVTRPVAMPVGVKQVLSVNAPDFSDQLANRLSRMRVMSRPGMGDQVRISLDPKDLGELDLRLRVDGDNQVHILITTESESAKEALMKQMGQLREALARQDLGFGEVMVQVGQEEGNDKGQWQFDQSAFNGREKGGPRHRVDGLSEANGPLGPIPPPSMVDESGVNLVV
ncbi:MAG: flagellar hook-length control protein FliK [Magnetococcales bacterium]|nr:flagellar hook-length control protein FliK [Magnetococcales bacterium]